MGDGGSWKVTPDVERYDEALDWFGKRTVITGDQAARLDDRLKAEAFWVGGGLKLAQVQRVFDAINVALAKGQTFEDFQKSVRTELRDPAHAELVFRNATQRAYNAGRWAQMYDPETLRFRPFGLVDAVLDARTTHYCRAVNGTLLPLDDPWWDTHWFPAHHHCRTSVRNLRRSEAERRGVKQPPNLTDPDPGWGQSPKLLQPWKPDPKKHEPGLVAELEKQAAGGGTKKRAKREPQHEAKAWTKTYAEYGRAAASLASGRAALEHGLDLPAQDVLQHLDALDAPVVGVLKAALRGTDAQRTLREQAGEIDPLRKVAAALAGHLAKVKPRPAITHSNLDGEPVGSRALRFFSRMTGPNVKHPGEDWRFSASQTGRSYATPALKRVLYNTQRPGALQHEWGHVLEDLNPTLMRRAIAFLRARTKNEKLEELSKLTGLSYSSDEKARPDKFFDPYIGKAYEVKGKPWATEITSLGTEVWFAGRYGLRNIGMLAQHDIEHLLFVLGQLAGP